MPQPQPRKLDHCCPQPRIAGFGHALLVRDRAALPGCRRQSCVGRDLLSVGKAPIEPLRPKDSGKFWTDPSQTDQYRLWRWRLVGLCCRGEQGVPFRFDGLDLPKKQLEPIELAVDLTFEMRRQRTPIARLQLVEPLASIAAQRLVVGDALREQQSFDPVDVLDPLDGQRLALAANPAAVFVFRRRHPDHGTDARLAALVSEQRANQGLAVDPVGLGPATPTRGRDR